MARNEQGGQLPGGMGGLVQYYDVGDEPFQLDPKVVVGVILSFVGFEILLHARAAGLF